MSEIRPSDHAIAAAARILDQCGRHYHWWDKAVPKYKDMDPIGKNEFEAIVEQMLMSAAKASAED